MIPTTKRMGFGGSYVQVYLYLTSWRTDGGFKKSAQKNQRVHNSRSLKYFNILVIKLLLFKTFSSDNLVDLLSLFINFMYNCICITIWILNAKYLFIRSIYLQFRRGKTLYRTYGYLYVQLLSMTVCENVLVFLFTFIC